MLDSLQGSCQTLQPWLSDAHARKDIAIERHCLLGSNWDNSLKLGMQLRDLPFKLI